MSSYRDLIMHSFLLHLSSLDSSQSRHLSPQLHNMLCNISLLDP